MNIPTSLLLKVVVQIVKSISPEIKNLLNDFILSLHEKAKETDNPWDDIIVQLLADIFLNRN